MSSATAAPIRPAAVATETVRAEPDPVADLHSLDEVKADSIGKTILVRVHRGSTSASSFTAHECGHVGSHAPPATIAFAPADADLVRAVPTGILPKTCARVLGKVTGLAQRTSYPSITLTKIYDVTPAAPAKPADGADYANLDDVSIDGAKAVGKIVELSMWRGPLERGSFAGHDCRDGANLLDMLKVSYGSSQAEATKIGEGGYPKKCSTVRVKLTKLGFVSWSGELLEVKG